MAQCASAHNRKWLRMVKLIIEDDEGKTTAVPLIRDEITIGRKEGNTIRLTERNISRRHAKLVKQNGALFIEDLNSYNGIKVNGNKIAGRVAVTEGDRIQIGDYVLGLKLEGVVEGVPAVVMVPSAAPHPAPSESARTMELPRPSDAPTAQIEVDDGKISEIETPAPAKPPAVAPTAETAGRLVCVSTNFPGKEWLLDRSISVIGRTEDNDVVINHRSISRHHARIVEENGRHTIIDLQSSNGVRVNGEEYGKVELRRGDLVDLGHVRLRFVAPGEDFVFARDASVVDISKGGGSRAGIWAAVIVVVAAGVGFAVWKLGPLGGKPGTVSADAQAGATGTGDPGHGSATGADPSRILTEIKESLKSEQWGDAIASCEKLTGEAKTRASGDCEKARKEKDAKLAFDDAHSAFMLNKPEDVIRRRKQIPEDSVYKNRDTQELEQARAQLVSKLKTQLDDLVAQKPCDKDKADDLVRSIKDLDPTNTEADATAKKCKEHVAVAPVEKKAVKKIAVVIPKKDIKKDAPPVDEVALAQQVQEAQKAYVSGQHSRARDLARQILRVRASHQDAIRILGASCCALKDKGGAKWAYERVSAASRNTLKQICTQYSVSLD
jgi:pSer/pThr/pTyr-binding forkhead associated (FHA) protein